jgi:general secretion pathway protein A
MLRAMDPFGATCDPRLYVPRLGSEAALMALCEGFAAGRVMSVLSGPPGLGKTMVLRVLAERLRGAQCAYVPVPSLGIEELAQVALDAFGEPTAGDRASVALAAFALRAPSAPAVLLVDDASAIPMPTARALREIADALGGALRVVAAAVDDARSAAAIAALGGEVLHVRLRHALTPSEVRAYVRGRLERAGKAEDAAALQDEHLDWLAAESAGVPREVNTLLTQILHADLDRTQGGLLGSELSGGAIGAGPEQLTLWDAPGAEALEAEGSAADPPWARARKRS